MAAVSIPVMAKARIGHIVEYVLVVFSGMYYSSKAHYYRAQILEAIGVDYIDESEVLTPADPTDHLNKHDFSEFGTSKQNRVVLTLWLFSRCSFRMRM